LYITISGINKILAESMFYCKKKVLKTPKGQSKVVGQGLR